MYVGMARISLLLADAHSLKEKRMVVRRVKDRVRDRLGVFVSEVGSPEIKDSWQRMEREEEGELLKKATTSNMANMVWYYHHETAIVNNRVDEIQGNARRGWTLWKQQLSADTIGGDGEFIGH